MFFVFFLTLPFILNAQTPSTSKVFVDERDKNAYPIVEIGGQTWLAADLRYISPKAHYQDKVAAAKGNFYYWEEADEVCPAGWRLTSKDDWTNFCLDIVHKVAQTSPNLSSVFEVFSFNTINQLALIFKQETQLDFLGEHTLLNIIPVGRIEDGVADPSTTYIDYWTTGIGTRFPYYHIHISNNILQGHSHKHHVSKQSKKRRLFRVRCVQVE